MLNIRFSRKLSNIHLSLSIFRDLSWQSEILNGKRKLSLSMIRKLYEVMGIPAPSLIGEY